MRKLLAGIPALFLLLTFVSYAQKETGPETLTFKSKMGDVLYNHAAHVKSQKGDCKVCHDKLWPQKAGAPLGFKAPHVKLETANTSCGFCHHKGGQAFTTVGNCKKCHGTAKAG